MAYIPSDRATTSRMWQCTRCVHNIDTTFIISDIDKTSAVETWVRLSVLFSDKFFLWNSCIQNVLFEFIAHESKYLLTVVLLYLHSIQNFNLKNIFLFHKIGKILNIQNNRGENIPVRTNSICIFQTNSIRIFQTNRNTKSNRSKWYQQIGQLRRARTPTMKPEAIQSYAHPSKQDDIIFIR